MGFINHGIAPRNGGRFIPLPVIFL
ncbi:glycogen debranching enzyme GlgX domain protein, partial [Yersinia pestis PY-88]